MSVRKIVDRNGRLFGKIRVIDLLVLLIVIVLVVAVYTKNNRLDASNTSQANTSITFTVLAENVPLYVADAIQTGDKVYDTERSSGGALGAITEVETLPASKTEQLRDGTFAALTNADAVNLRITVQGSGSVSGGRYMINRVYALGVNANRNLCTNYASFTGSVMEIG